MTYYISREAAIKAVSENDYEGYATIAVKAIHAADVVEVVHGKWLRTPTWWVYCSVCGCKPPQETNATTRFCPNCGAKMDGGADG